MTQAPQLLNEVQVRRLGVVAYRDALAIQAEIQAQRQADEQPDTLLLLEHPPVYTRGRRAGDGELSLGEGFYRARGIEIVPTDRGGKVTYHGPGQLVGYPILDLRSFSPRLGAVEYVRLLEDALIRACGDFGVPAQRIAGRTGVWTIAGGSIPEKKVAAIGVHVARGITSHGFALNVTTDLRDFDLIVPCGISDRTVTSLDLEARPENTMNPVPTMEFALHAVAKQFGRVFNHQVLWLESLVDLDLEEPILQRQAG